MVNSKFQRKISIISPRSILTPTKIPSDTEKPDSIEEETMEEDTFYQKQLSITPVLTSLKTLKDAEEKSAALTPNIKSRKSEIFTIEK